MQKLKQNKRMVLSCLSLAIVSIVFWTQFRYPRMIDKAEGFERDRFATYYFDTIVPVFKEYPALRKVALHAVNWGYSNRQGMIYGVLLAAIVMTLLRGVRPVIRTQNRFLQSLYGLFIGAPQGVCVNCATPVGQGLLESGLPRTTVLSVVVSSPTLNLVGLGFLLTSGPIIFFLSYISLVLILIFIALPLITKSEKTESTLPQSCEVEEPPAVQTWPQALRDFIFDFLKSLFHVFKISVPFMLLAGVIGAVIHHYFPFEQVVNSNWQWWQYYLTGFFFTLIPVPMLFDLIIGHEMLLIGVPTGIALMTTFCLGAFSAYPMLLFSKTMSRALMLKLFVAVWLIGSTAGIASTKGSEWWINHLYKSLPQTNFAKYIEPRINSTEWPKQSSPQSFMSQAQSNIEIKGWKLNPPKELTERFEKIPAKQFGIENDIMHAYAELVGTAVAVIDMNEDIWPDMVVATDDGFRILFNSEGKSFSSYWVRVQDFGLTPSITHNLNLGDFNRDGKTDVVFANSTHLLIWLNAGGDRKQEKMQTIASSSPGVDVKSIAVGDIDRNGFLDIVLGHGSVYFGPDTDPNADMKLYLNNAMSFTKTPLHPEPGLTLSIMLMDMNQDGRLDLYAANDVSLPDRAFLGTPSGQLKEVLKSDKYIPLAPIFSMGIDLGDYNNDLLPDLLLVGMSNPAKKIDKRFADDPAENLDAKWFFLAAYNYETTSCQYIQNEKLRSDCYTLIVSYLARTLKKPDSCSILLPAEGNHNWCRYSFIAMKDHPRAYQPSLEDIPQARGSILLKGNGDRFIDATDEAKTRDTGWGWAARFIDLNNDGWEDIYMATGIYIMQFNSNNVLFINNQNGSFVRKEKPYGLEQELNVFNYVYIDYDLDGRPDLFMKPALGHYDFYKNQVTAGNSFAIELIDQRLHTVTGSTIEISYKDANAPEKQNRAIRFLTNAGGYKSVQMGPVHFGLGQASTVSEIEISWADGEKSVLKGPFQANSIYKVKRK